MTTSPRKVEDAELQQLARTHGRGSAEAYILLELVEARSAGDDVSAYERRGRYTIGAADRSTAYRGDV